MNSKVKFIVTEAIATAILVLVGCGGAILAFQTDADGLMTRVVVGISFFIGVILLAYTLGYFSNAHANPSVTIGHIFAKKLSFIDGLYHIVGQFIGAVISGFVLYAGFGFQTGEKVIFLASNNFTGSAVSAGVWEFFITFIFVTIILHVASKKNVAAIAPLLIATTLGTLVFLSLPITGGSLNAARSFGVAIFNGGAPLSNVWLFLIAPTLGGAAAGLLNLFMKVDLEPIEEQ